MNTIIEKLKAIIRLQIKRENLNFAALGGGGQTWNIETLEWVLKRLSDLEKEEKPMELDFEQELYKHFGQVKDFTLGMHIAKHFYELGRQSECVKVKAESALDKFASKNCVHCSIEHCPGVKACYT